MNVLEIVLLILGVLVCFVSFFVSEKLTNKDKDNLQKLSKDQIEEIIRDKMADAKVEMEDILSQRIDEAMEELDRKTDKETTDKIMQISEYSDTVLESVNKSHQEVMFMYSMLNEKQTDITEMTKDLVNIKDSIVSLDASIAKKIDIFRDKEIELNKMEQSVAAPIERDSYENKEDFVPMSFTEKLAAKNNDDAPAAINNSNMEILTLHDEGLSDVDIAKKLGRGLGEIRFVLGLYQED